MANCYSGETRKLATKLPLIPVYSDPILFGAGGNPYGTSLTVDQDGKMIEDVEGAVKYQAKRTVTVAESVKKEINKGKNKNEPVIMIGSFLLLLCLGCKEKPY